MFVCSRVKQRVEFVKAAADASYLWLKLKDVVLGCPEVYLCVCYMPQNRVSTRSDLLPLLHMNVCRMMFWNTKAEVPRS